MTHAIYLAMNLDFTRLCECFAPAKFEYGEYQRMIDNFIRLHLIEIPEDKFLSGKDAYADFYLDDVMKKIHVSLREGYELSHIPGVILPTVLGRDFYKICISES